MEKKLTPIVIYHANCWDGFCAAWLFSKAYPDAEFVPAQYGQDPPEVANDRDRPLFIVDFSYPRDVMFRLAGMRHERMVVLDHHKTAWEALRELDIELDFHNCGGALTTVFDMSKSGGRLAWEFLYGNRLLPDDWLSTSKSGYSLGVAPWLVDYTEDRDLWRWALPFSREVNAFIRSFSLEFNQWDVFHTAHPMKEPSITIAGAAILRRERQIIDDHLRHARDIEMDGYTVPCVNATVLFSDIAGELAKDKPFGVCYFDRADGKRQYSLRSRDGGVDVSEIAKAHGGGGHRNAAGFEESLSP